MTIFDNINIDARRLVEILLDQQWQMQCQIIPDYMPPFPSKDTRPTVQIRFNNGKEHMPYLRYSKGPLQGYFWDIYGSDMHSIEVAIVALSRAPPPCDVSPITISLPNRSQRVNDQRNK